MGVLTHTSCSVPTCERPHAARGFCKRHWSYWKRHGVAVVQRFPMAPLERKIKTLSAAVLAEVLGIRVRQIYRWRRSGLTLDQADELAIRIGCHPLELWPEWADLDDAERPLTVPAADGPEMIRWWVA